MSTKAEWALLGGAVVGFGLATWLRRRQNDSSSEVIEAVKSRRSLFLPDYNGDDVPDSSVELMLEAANWAPSHGLTQPWRFHVFRRSTGELEKFFRSQLDACEAALKCGLSSQAATEACKKFVGKYPKNSKLYPKCSHVIAISMKAVANPEKIMPEWEEMCACACAVQNAHIVACQLGVASYWSSAGGFEGPLATKELRALLGLEGDDKCLGVMYVGRANSKTWSNTQERAKRDPISEKAKWH
eukprot:CAMPEP_0197652310 /NCGR_PEP_ID=MMETSP1338-20131121/34372_1 /TAXON_ID=43686 ORGANISM="Pelagodinium beii, Strain RCC1491" /NCGR_SAMPLE_ID=MMETSP1338 /ASSEMBLY_ACC=CAM_ASM_000754 /LENGTH=242 /DNA_ID=CAMNT_0043227157 /DNA_START=40 /DNA_END=768 /DNA_ORIENTATION=+